MTHSGSIYKLSEKSNGQKPTRILRKISFFGKSLNGTFPIKDMPWPVSLESNFSYNDDICIIPIIRQWVNICHLYRQVFSYYWSFNMLGPAEKFGLESSFSYE